MSESNAPTSFAVKISEASYPSLLFSFERSLKRLGIVSVYICLSSFSLSSIGVGNVTKDLRFEYLADVGVGLIEDSGWLLPALLAVNVTLIAVIAAQAAIDTDAAAVAQTHNIVALTAPVVSAFAITAAIGSGIAAWHYPDQARHLIAIGFLTLLIIGFGLWACVVVFGKPSEQLRVALASNALSTAAADRLPKIKGTVWRAYLTILVIVITVAMISFLAPLAYYFIHGIPVEGLLGYAALCALFAAYSTATAWIIKDLFSTAARQWPRVAQYGVLAVLLLIAPVVLVLSSFPAAMWPFAAIWPFMLLMPAALSWLPATFTRFPAQAINLGNAVRTIARSRLDGRIRRSQVVINAIGGQETALDLSHLRAR